MRGGGGDVRGGWRKDERWRREMCGEDGGGGCEGRMEEGGCEGRMEER